MADSGKTKVTVNCCDCGTLYQITLKTYKANCKHDPSHQYRCSKCLSKAISDKRSEGQRNRWANTDKEIKIKHGELLHNNLIKWKDKLSEEELKALNAKAADGIRNMNAEQKENKRKRQSIGMKKNWATKSQSYKDNKMNHLHDKAKDWWNSLSEDEKSDRLNHLHDKSSEWRNTLSNNEIIHCWDYAAFDSDNKLIAVIDLDGMYPKEEYDEKRPLSIPDGVKMFIITEYDFFRCFKYMCMHISDNYDQYIDSLFNACRTQPFPVYKYTDYELIKSYNTLCKMNCNDKYHQNISLNTRVGDRLIQHFHESIWMDKCKGELSPYEAWNDDEMLRKCIENRVIFQNNLNPYKVLQGFNISKIAPKVSVFSAGRAKMLINKYLSEYDEIFDPFSGYSGRMLGAISLNKTYIGQDISIIHVNESNTLIKFLHDNGFKFYAEISCKNVLTSTGKYQCLFTCPPYADKEQWQDVPVSLRSCDDWIDECLQRFDCKKYVFVVDSTKNMPTILSMLLIINPISIIMGNTL